ncbi:MAG: hypothetical protein HY396_02550 [Candidatus Doudnabacteria bacterium]|nr:hypothetical protein [Candidatus Doudnabacteria bacterium]
MSSGVFEYTAEEKAALLDQFGDVLGLVQERKRHPRHISRALQAAIGDDEIVVVPKIIQTPTGKIFHVTSDGKIRTAADAISALNCPVKWGLAEKPVEIPMIIQPVDCRVRVVPLGEIRTTEEVYSLYPGIVSPAEFFAFGTKFPEEQREAPIFTVWLDALGRFWEAILAVYVRERDVGVSRVRPDIEWLAYCRVLVREFLSA